MMMVTESYSAQQEQPTREDRFQATAGDRLSVQEIAELADHVIGAMTRDELIDVIDAARSLLPQCDLDTQRLALRERPMLQRLACLARRACRNYCTLQEQAAVRPGQHLARRA